MSDLTEQRYSPRPEQRVAHNPVQVGARSGIRLRIEQHLEQALTPALQAALGQMLTDGILASMGRGPNAGDVVTSEQLWPYRVHLRVTLQDLEPPPPAPEVDLWPAGRPKGVDDLPAAYAAAMLALAHGGEAKCFWGGHSVIARYEPGAPDDGYVLWQGAVWALMGLAQLGLADVEVLHDGSRRYTASLAGLSFAADRLRTATP